jgi:hypothetical protein
MGQSIGESYDFELPYLGWRGHELRGTDVQQGVTGQHWTEVVDEVRRGARDG